MPGHVIDNLGSLQQRERRYEQPSSAPTYMPLEYPIPPSYAQINPALREALQSQEVVPERHRHRGTRKAYIPGISGQYLDKPALLHFLNTIRPYKEQRAYNRFGNGINLKRDDGTFYHSPEEREHFQRIYENEREKAKKETERDEFSLLHQYRLSKHDTPIEYLNGLLGFGGLGGSASKFINGFSPDIKGWKDMSPLEKDEFIARENAIRNSPERIARRQRGQESALLAQGLQASRQQAEQETRSLNAMPPGTRDEINYNRQVQNYMNQQNVAEHRNQAQFIKRNQEMQSAQNMIPNISISQPVMNELISMINSKPTRYVPVRNRPSFNDRVMSSFDENMFNPEFISGEE